MDDAQETTGGLASIPPAAAANLPAASNPVEEKMQEYAKARIDLINQQKALIDSLQSRVSQPADKLMAMSQAFLTPGRTGSFGEAAGNVMGIMRKSEEEENARRMELAKMRFALGQQQLGMAKEDVETARGTGIESAIKNLYTVRKGPFGEDIPTLNQTAATQLAVLTRNPEFAQKMIADQRSSQIQNAIATAFKPTTDESGKTTYTFDPSSVSKILGAGGSFEDVAKIAKAIPDLRRAGMFGGPAVEGTPFDAIALMAPSPELKAHAERLQKQYKAGAFKDEDAAEKSSQQLLQLMTSHMDRQQQMQFQQMLQSMMFGLKQQQADLNMEKFKEKQKENESKLTDQQKIDYNKIVVPVINEGAKANSALNQLYSIEDKIKKAPSGVISGAFASSVGRLFGTDENTALRELEQIQKSLLTQIPRLPGSQSNFDAQNLEKSIGRLSDISLTNQQRIQLINNVKEGFKKLADRAFEIQTYWDTNKEVSPSLFGKGASETKTIVKTGTVQSGPNQGKTVILYSDGTQEYK